MKNRVDFSPAVWFSFRVWLIAVGVGPLIYLLATIVFHRSPDDLLTLIGVYLLFSLLGMLFSLPALFFFCLANRKFLARFRMDNGARLAISVLAILINFTLFTIVDVVIMGTGKSNRNELSPVISCSYAAGLLVGVWTARYSEEFSKSEKRVKS
ncbi:hypothetical protein [Spirosoma harenae]